MRFRFDFTLDEQDYLRFYTFHTMYARHGRKRFVVFRWIVTIFPLILAILTATGKSGRMSWDMLLNVLPYLLTAVVLYFCYGPLTKFSVRSSVRRQKKKGDLPFSPKVGLWFYEDRFIESTPEEKTTVKYSSVYAIYAQGRQMLYIYIDPLQAYLLPFTEFSTPERYEEFVRFMELKTGVSVQDCKALPPKK